MPQKNMKHILYFIAFLLLTVSPQTSAETPDGTIPFDCPDVPNTKFQFHFTRELIELAVTTAPFNTADDLYIHIYDDELGVYDKLIHHYSEKLKAKNWHGIQEDDRVGLYVLRRTAMQSPQADNTVTGTFAIVKGDAEIYLLNIVGSIPVEQMVLLLTDLGELGIGIPELESLLALEIDKRSLSSPTGFRIADGSPIYDIQIKGNQKIDQTEILETLRAGNEDLNKAVEALRKEKGSELEKVESSIKEENGRHTAVITVKEHSPSRSSGSFTVNPVIRFNRVSGWQSGATSKIDVAGARLPNGMPTSNIFTYTGYGFGSKITNYEIGIDTLPFATYTRFNNPEADADKWYHGFGINARVHRTTDITPQNVSPYRVDNSANDPFGLLYTIFGAEDLHNYYLRRGFEIAFRWQLLPRMEYIPPRHLVALTLLAENHKSLEKSTDWHLFNWRSTSKARENPAITPGRMRSVMFRYDLNLRQGSPGTDSLGWHNTFSVEHSNATFGSDFDFTRYQLHLRYAHPLGEHRIRTRAVGSFSTAALPIQRQFTIGGPGVLNGYPVYAFAGDRGYLFNIEYFHNLQELFTWRNIQFDFFNLFLVLFLDAGQTWNVTDETHPLVPKGDAGIGFQFGESDSFLRFNIAQAFESEQSVQFNLLWFYSF